VFWGYFWRGGGFLTVVSFNSQGCHWPRQVYESPRTLKSDWIIPLRAVCSGVITLFSVHFLWKEWQTTGACVSVCSVVSNVAWWAVVGWSWHGPKCYFVDADYTYLFITVGFSTMYTGCPRRNVPNFGRVFLMLNYTDITQNTYIQSWTVTEIMAREVRNFDSCYTLTDYQIHIETGRNMWFL